MGIGPDAAKKLSLWEFEALKATWNRRHDPDGDLKVVTPEKFAKTEELFAANPHLLN